MRPVWGTVVLMLLGLLFLLLPIALPFGTTAVWTMYVGGLAAGVVIAALTTRWYRATVLESGPHHRVIRTDAVRAAKRAAQRTATEDATDPADTSRTDI